MIANLMKETEKMISFLKNFQVIKFHDLTNYFCAISEYISDRKGWL